ncbi:MAG: hypothetical protein ACLUNQ_05900 [Oscillospiraceae bacterium]
MFAYGIGGMLAGLFALCGILKKSPRAWRDGGWRDILGLTVFGFCVHSPGGRPPAGHLHLLHGRIQRLLPSGHLSGGYCP